VCIEKSLFSENGRGVHRCVHPAEIIRRRFSGDRAVGQRVWNPARRLMARLATLAKSKVVAWVAEIVAGVFSLHGASRLKSKKPGVGWTPGLAENHRFNSGELEPGRQHGRAERPVGGRDAVTDRGEKTAGDQAKFTAGGVIQAAAFAEIYAGVCLLFIAAVNAAAGH
jgi:hypothetical protein